MTSIRQYRITARHDHGIYSMVIYGHSSEKSAIDCFLDIEKAPLSSIIKVENLSTEPRSMYQSII
jgi:aminoglycoside N3'-acetyltransferase